jgi:hypothetical protein
MQERVDEVAAEADGDDECDYRIAHGRTSEPVAAGGVGAHQREAADTEGDVEKIEHMFPLQL